MNRGCECVRAGNATSATMQSTHAHLLTRLHNPMYLNVAPSMCLWHRVEFLLPYSICVLEGEFACAQE